MLKKVSRLLNSAAPISRNSPECPDTSHDELPHDHEFIAGMLLGFSAVWGAKFNPSGSAMPLLVDLWAEGLAEMTKDEIRERFLVCRRTMDWPPSIAEFLGSEASKPQSAAEWQQFGRRIGMEAAPGESWDGYIARLRRSWVRQPWRVQQSPRLESPAARGVLTHDND